MRKAEESIVRRLGKALRVRLESDAHDPLPRRWVELIQCLNEQERMQLERQPAPEPRRQ
jgi:hypothetical protein